MTIFFAFVLVGFCTTVAKGAPSSPTSYYNYWQRLTSPSIGRAAEVFVQQGDLDGSEDDGKMKELAQLMSYWQRFTRPSLSKMATVQQDDGDSKMKELAQLSYWQRFIRPSLSKMAAVQQIKGYGKMKKLAELMSYHDYWNPSKRSQVLLQEEDGTSEGDSKM